MVQKPTAVVQKPTAPPEIRRNLSVSPKTNKFYFIKNFPKKNQRYFTFFALLYKNDQRCFHSGLTKLVTNGYR